MQFSIPADHPSLPGHFPGQPIVPGVVVLERVLEAVLTSRVAHGAEHSRMDLGGLRSGGHTPDSIEADEVIEAHQVEAALRCGTMIFFTPSSAANTPACAGPAPPKANSTKSRGSKPFSTVTLRMMSAICSSTMRQMPAAHSIAHAIGQHDAPIFLVLAAPNRDLPTIEIDILHA